MTQRSEATDTPVRRHATELVDCLRARRLSPPAPGAMLEIAVERIEAIPYRDLLEVWLHATGQRQWRWVDARERRAPAGAMLGALARVAFDFALLPFIYALHWLRVAYLLRAARARRAAEATCLYLRLDHNFDLRGGGSVAHTAGVINAFRRLLPRVTVLSTDRLNLVEADASFIEITPRYGLGRNVPGFPLFAYSRQLATQARATLPSRPGFIYARASSGNYAPLELKRAWRCAYVCEYNGAVAWIARNWGQRRLRFERLFTHVETANLAAADLVVVVSQASADEVAARGIPRSRILVNPNGVDPRAFDASLSGAEVRARLGIGQRDFVIGFIGTFGPWHGAEVLAQAFVALLRATSDVERPPRLLLIGDGTTAAATHRILDLGGALPRVIATGTIVQAEAPAHLAACDVFASPHVPNPDGSPFFGSPTKLFEYMAMGRAIVASALDQIGTILEHERTALLVPPADPAALCGALQRLRDDAPLRQRLGASARARALACHTWDAHARRILEALPGAAVLTEAGAA